MNKNNFKNNKEFIFDDNEDSEIDLREIIKKSS